MVIIDEIWRGEEGSGDREVVNVWRVRETVHDLYQASWPTVSRLRQRHPAMRALVLANQA